MSRYIMCSIVGVLVTFLISIAYATPTKVTLSGQAHFVVDSAHGKLLGKAPVKGELSIDFDQPKTLDGQLSVSVSEMKVNNEIHRDHLRSENWFNTNKCPHVTFETKSSEVLSFKPADDSGISTIKLSIEGRMTLSCVTSVFRLEKLILKRKGQLSKVGSIFNIGLQEFKVYGAKDKLGQKNHIMRVTLNLDGK